MKQCERPECLATVGTSKEIPKFPMYSVTDQGQIYSEHSNRFLTPELNKSKGYLRVTLYVEGKRKKLLVHVLVAESFIPNPDNKPYINHINGNKLDNSVGNLEWVTHAENMSHAFSTGLNENPQGSSARNYKGDILVFREGVHIDTLSGNIDMRNKGYSPSGVSQVLNGVRKTHKGCTFQRR